MRRRAGLGMQSGMTDDCSTPNIRREEQSTRVVGERASEDVEKKERRDKQRRTRGKGRRRGVDEK